MKNIRVLLFNVLFVIIIMVLNCTVALANGSNPSFTLMYHDLCNENEKETAFIIKASKFESDIKYLLEKGYDFYFASEMDEALINSDGKNCVVITFDDGYESGYTKALPILEKYGVKATIFMIGRKVDVPGFLSTEQLKALAESPYIEIGNHSNKIHGNSSEAVINMYNRDALGAMADYNENAQKLEAITSKKITSASYPYGIYTEYLNAWMNYYGYTTYSSVEKVCRSGNSPYPRYNRSDNFRIETIVNSAFYTNNYYMNFENGNKKENANTVTVYENGNKFIGKVIFNDGITMLPIGFLTENINALYERADRGSKVIIRKNGSEIVLTNDSDIAVVNGEEHEMGTSVVSYMGQMYAPARFVSEHLGASVAWDAKHRTVLIY